MIPAHLQARHNKPKSYGREFHVAAKQDVFIDIELSKNFSKSGRNYAYQILLLWQKVERVLYVCIGFYEFARDLCAVS